MLKPIQLDLPYPSLDCITCDLKSAQIVFPAYASAHSELTEPPIRWRGSRLPKCTILTF